MYVVGGHAAEQEVEFGGRVAGRQAYGQANALADLEEAEKTKVEVAAGRDVEEESKRVAFLGRGHAGSRLQTKASLSRRPEITAVRQGKFARRLFILK